MDKVTGDLLAEYEGHRTSDIKVLYVYVRAISVHEKVASAKTKKKDWGGPSFFSPLIYLDVFFVERERYKGWDL